MVAQNLFHSPQWTRRLLTFHGNLYQEKRVTEKLFCMKSRPSSWGKEICANDLSLTAPLSIRRWHMLSCLTWNFVLNIMSLFELTQQKGLDPMANLWNWKHQVSLMRLLWKLYWFVRWLVKKNTKKIILFILWLLTIFKKAQLVTFIIWLDSFLKLFWLNNFFNIQGPPLTFLFSNIILQDLTHQGNLK